MKILLSLSALLITLTLTAQSTTATWYLNDTSMDGIQSPTSTASGTYSTAMGNYTTASGSYSTAMGTYTTALGYNSTAMGFETTASGEYSTAMGTYTTASGGYSTAMGFETTASGEYSTAMGYSTTASDYNSLVVGRYNLLGSTVTNSNFQFSTENTAFVIGNGTANDSRSDALTVLFDGTTNIAGDVTAPAFIGDGSQLTNLPTPTVNYSDITNVPLSYNENGTGIQSSSNNASGDYSIAMGRNTTASGTQSTAMGRNTTASGTQSTAMGYLTTASGTQSTAIGLYTTASGTQSRAMGYNTTASGYISTAMGTNTTASGGVSTAMGLGTATQDYASTAIGAYNKTKETPNPSEFSLQNTAFVIGNGTDESRSNAFEVLFDGTTNVAGSVTATAFIGDGSQLTNLSVSSPFSFNNTSGNGIQSNNNVASGNHSRAMGYDTTASGDYSTAMGAETTVSGNWSTAMGFRTKVTQNFSTAMGRETTASGNYSTVMGAFTKASDFASVVIGYYNSSGYSETSWNSLSTLAPAFVIGNGTNSDNRSDALTVLFDGTTTIAGDLSINSDARLKANIISLGSTLAKLLQIDGKTYTMKKDESEKQKIGLLAQDIEKVFPELVSESNGIKSVNYQGLVPVLINALKEQQAEIDRLKTQEERLDILERLVAAMD